MHVALHEKHPPIHLLHMMTAGNELTAIGAHQLLSVCAQLA
jgi:hypothetical protein